MATASAKVSATDSTTYKMSEQKIIGPARAAMSDMICAKEGSAAPPMAAIVGAAPMMQRNMIENTTMLSTSEMPMTMAMGTSVTASSWPQLRRPFSQMSFTLKPSPRLIPMIMRICMTVAAT